MFDNLQIQTRHVQIANILRSEIAILPVGSKMESQNVLAKRFGVSVGTVREALVCLNNEGLIERRHGSGTFVAEQKEEKAQPAHEKHIAVLIDQDIAHPQLSYAHKRVMETLLWYFAEQQVPAKRYTGRKPPWQLANDGEPTCDTFRQAVENDEIKAVVLPRGFTHPKWADILRQRNVPIIGEWGSSTRIISDYPGVMKQAVERMHASGRKKIALLGWHHKGLLANQSQDILHAFKQSMQNCGLPVRPEWIRYDMPVQAVGAGWGGFREIWSAPCGHPDALIVMDDVLFRDAATAILELGIQVPDTLTIATQANKNSALFCPLPVSLMISDPDDIAFGLAKLTSRILNKQPIDDINTTTYFSWEDYQKPEIKSSNKNNNALTGNYIYSVNSNESVVS